MKAAIVYSGSGGSQEVLSQDNQDTLIQLNEISAHLNQLGVHTVQLELSDSLGKFEKNLRLHQPDFVFNLVETLNGTDGLIYLAAALYEYCKIPYTGCSAITLAQLASKIEQKKMLQLAGLPTAEFFTATGNNARAIGPWIIKSDTEHASVGMTADSVVQTSQAAQAKLNQMSESFGGNWFCERFIDGREFNISLLENDNGQPQVLPAAEIRFVDFPADLPRIVDYAAKWDADSKVYSATQRHFDFSPEDASLLTQLDQLCRQCWDLFSLKGAARVDFRIDNDGRPWILEVNANPCLSADAGFMVAAARASLDGSEVIRRLLPRYLLTKTKLFPIEPG